MYPFVGIKQWSSENPLQVERFRFFARFGVHRAQSSHCVPPSPSFDTDTHVPVIVLMLVLMLMQVILAPLSSSCSVSRSSRASLPSWASPCSCDDSRRRNAAPSSKRAPPSTRAPRQTISSTAATASATLMSAKRLHHLLYEAPTYMRV